MVDNGFTYTSPSVYVIYSELQATVSATGACDSSASGDPVGPSYAFKTIGYSSRFLAYGTVTFPGPNCDEQYVEDGFHTIDFTELYYTPIVTTTTYKAGCAPYANPRLSLPADLTDVVPAWKTCQPLFYGAFDPPSILTKASRLAPAPVDPATVTPTPPPVPISPAAAHATPAAETPAATIAPTTNGQKAGTLDPPASIIDPSDGISLTGNAHGVVPITTASPADNDPKPKEGAADNDPSGQVIGLPAPVVVNAPVQTQVPAANIVVAQGQTLTENGPSANFGGKAAVYSSGSLYLDSSRVAVPIGTQITPANVVAAQGQTLTEGGPSANVGGKAAVYSEGSIYLDSSSPVAAPKAEDTNVVVAQGHTLIENGPPASIGGKAAVYSAGSVYYDSTPIPIPKASPTNVVVAQGQTLTENGPAALVDGRTAVYKAGSIYYDSTPVAIGTSTQGQRNPPPVVAAGITFAPTVQTPPPVVTNGITFAPAVEKGSPVVAGGITFEPKPYTVGSAISEPIVAGGITFHPSNIQGSNPIAPETPAPLSVNGNPVLKAANGDLIVAGTTIPPGSTAKLLGHSLVANFDNVIVDGTTHSLAPVTAYPAETPTSTPLEIANQPVLIATNGDLVVAGSTIAQGSTTRLLHHAISVGSDNVVVDGTTHTFAPVTASLLETPTPLQIANEPVFKAANGGIVFAGSTIPPGSQTSLLGHVISIGANGVIVDDGNTLTFAATTEAAAQQSALPNQVFVQASASATTPAQLFVKASPSPAAAEEYVYNGKTATAPAPSDVPLGGIILAGFGADGPSNRSTTPFHSSLLPSIFLVNSTGASSSTRVGFSPTSASLSGPGAQASPTKPVHGTGSRVVGWLWGSGEYVLVMGYILSIVIIM
ncbi:hypothetical protein BDR22DRAFT_94855 [Usnea florida]